MPALLLCSANLSSECTVTLFSPFNTLTAVLLLFFFSQFVVPLTVDFVHHFSFVFVFVLTSVDFFTGASQGIFQGNPHLTFSADWFTCSRIKNINLCNRLLHSQPPVLCLCIVYQTTLQLVLFTCVHCVLSL